MYFFYNEIFFSLYRLFGSGSDIAAINALVYEFTGFDNTCLIEPDSMTFPEFRIKISSAKYFAVARS